MIFFFFLKQGNPHIPADGPRSLHMWAAQIASGSNNFFKSENPKLGGDEELGVDLRGVRGKDINMIKIHCMHV